FYLARHAARYGLSKGALATAFVERMHDTGRGGIVVGFGQKVGGVDVFRQRVRVLLDRSLRLVAIGGNLHPSAVPHPKIAARVLAAEDALAVAFDDLYGASTVGGDFVDLKQDRGGYRSFALSPKAAGGRRLVVPGRAKSVLFPLPDRLVPATYVEIQARDRGTRAIDAYAYVVAADDGRVLYRQNLTHDDAFNYRVWADPNGNHRPADGPLADFTPHPTGTPDGSYPSETAPILVSVDGLNTNPQGTSDPWLPGNATQTQGNNVDAYTDDDNPDGFSAGDIRASTTSASTFDHVYDLAEDPQANDEQRMSAVTQLFFVTNWLHDWWYDAGFDEAAGEAQTDNFGRGGIAGDRLQAQAQDGAPGQRNNSNMTVPADGQSPRMQMFVWDGRDARSLTLAPSGQSLSTGVGAFGPQSYDVTGDVAIVDDGTAPTTDACEPIQNDLTGKIALVDRGTCPFEDKTVRAQQMGAVGVIIVDNVQEPLFEMAGNMGGATIPAMLVTQSDGASIEAALQNGPVTAHLSRQLGVTLDGTIDNSVIAHEWGHFLHLRQVACGSSQCQAESEGWGDFDALMMMVRPSDDLHGTYALAVYATGAFPNDPGYFGIRRYPYSVDFTKNASTFGLIADNAMLPAGVPAAPNGTPNSEPHAAGEEWAAMLFEAYVALLERSQGQNPAYSFDQARRRMSDYVETALTMAPVDPTFTEQRDAILAAAAANDPADFLVMAQAFARRGAGTCAASPARDSTDFNDVVETFTTNPNLAVTRLTLDDAKVSCDHDGILDAGETGYVTVTVTNTGAAPLTDGKVTVSTDSPHITFPSGAHADVGTLEPFQTAKVKIEAAFDDGVAAKSSVAVTAKVTSQASCVAMQTIAIGALANADVLPMSSKTDDVEAEKSPWKLDGTSADVIWTRQDTGTGNHAWIGVDYGSPSDTALESPDLKVGAAPFSMTFTHKHSFETGMGTNWDGGVLEVTTDGGATWNDASMYGDPHYEGPIGDAQSGATQDLVGRQGYVGQNASWPDTDQVTIDFGTNLANQTVKVRFRVASDDAQGDFGWQVDDIAFAGITNEPFATVADDMAQCKPSGSGGGGAGGQGGGHAAGG
ncbi:MAG TPA: M36 family metallopeptidase, partial [Minicystis sp.]|nr:M36 family metallopeptidase [Minicystis sp.]